MSEAERTVEEERPQADDRASDVRSWFQPVRPAQSSEASPAEASGPPDGETATAQQVRGSDSGSKDSGTQSDGETETETDTVIFPKLRVSRPPAQNGTATASTAAATAPAEAERTPPPDGGGSDGRASDGRATTQKARGLHSGSRSSTWPDVLNETEPETVILPKLRVSRPQAQNGTAASGATRTATRTGIAGHPPAGAKAGPPASADRKSTRLTPVT